MKNKTIAKHIHHQQIRQKTVFRITDTTYILKIMMLFILLTSLNAKSEKPF